MNTTLELYRLNAWQKNLNGKWNTPAMTIRMVQHLLILCVFSVNVAKP